MINRIIRTEILCTIKRKNKDLLNQIAEMDLHIPWFQILADAAQDCLDTREIEYTESCLHKQ